MTLSLPSKHGGSYIMKVLSFTKIIRRDFFPIVRSWKQKNQQSVPMLGKHFEGKRGDTNGS